MPDLSTEAASKFWHEYEDPMIYRVVTFMEGVEHWTYDGQASLETAMQKLSHELDDLDKIDINQEADFIKLACNIKTGRALRLLQAIDTAQPGSASKLLIHAEEVSNSEDDPAGIFLRRNIVFERLRLLARIFAPERLKLILKALEDDE